MRFARALVHARSCTRFALARVIGRKLNPREFIGQELFGHLMKGPGAISVGAGAVKIRLIGRHYWEANGCGDDSSAFGSN